MSNYQNDNQYQQFDDGYDRYAGQGLAVNEPSDDEYASAQEDHSRNGNGGDRDTYQRKYSFDDDTREYAGRVCEAPPGWFEGVGEGASYDGDGRGEDQYSCRTQQASQPYSSRNAEQQQQQRGQNQYQTRDQYPQQQSSQAQTQQGQQQGQYFEYSRCTGNRRALLIGINYIGSNNALKGCINDVNNIRQFLERYGYNSSNTVVLTDDSNEASHRPTRANILRAMKWLVEGAARDDALFFHYSGHGTQTTGGGATEADGMKEAICPLDYQTAGLIADDEMYDFNTMAKPLPVGCRLTALFDSCHSGTVMNLPYVYSQHGTVKDPNMLASAGQALFTAVPQYARGDTAGALKGFLTAGISAFKEKRADDLLKAENTLSADIITLSGCKDDQTSADTQEEGEATGAMSYAFVQAFSKNPQINYRDLLVAIRNEMIQGGYTQKPQLSACHPIDTKLDFVA